MVIDSSFDKLKHAILNIAMSHSSAPAFAIKTFLLFVSNTIKSKAKFDIYKVNPIDHVADVVIPTIFVMGQEDDVVKSSEFFSLHSKCRAQYKKLFIAKGDHTANRLDDDHFRQEMVTFVGHFFPMRKNAEQIIGVLKNKSMIPLVRSNLSQVQTDTNFDYNKVKNSIFMGKNQKMRNHIIGDSTLQPHLSVWQDQLTSQPDFKNYNQKPVYAQPDRQESSLSESNQSQGILSLCRPPNK